MHKILWIEERGIKMFKHAKLLGEFHKKHVQKNPDLKKKLDRQYDRFVQRFRLNSDHKGDRPIAYLQQKYQYPPEFIDRATGKPYYLFQLCPIAVYWSVDIKAGFQYLFARSVVNLEDGTRIFYWVPKYNNRIWHETDWATAEKTRQNLDWQDVTFEKDGRERRYRRPPRLANRYLTYDIKSQIPTGQDKKVKRLAMEDIYNSYKKWFEKNEKNLSGENPQLTFDASDLIKPVYRQISMNNVEYRVIDPVWNLGITIRALFALNQLQQRYYQSYPINVQAVKSNEFYKTYIKDINDNLEPKYKIDFDKKPEEVQTVDAIRRENINQIRLKSIASNGAFSPQRLTQEYIIEKYGNLEIPTTSIPKEIRKKNQRKTTLEKFIKAYKDIPYFIEYTLTENSEDDELEIKKLEYPDGTPIEVGQDLVNYLNPPQQWRTIATETIGGLAGSTTPFLQNNKYAILNDGEVFFPLSTSGLPYTKDNLERIFDIMLKNYREASRGQS